MEVGLGKVGRGEGDAGVENWCGRSWRIRKTCELNTLKSSGRSRSGKRFGGWLELEGLIDLGNLLLLINLTDKRSCSAEIPV